MKNRAFQYQLAFFSRMTLLTMLVMLLNMSIVAVTMYFLNRYHSGGKVMYGSIDSIACISMFVYGLIFFKPCFKFFLANGVTRRRFFLASFPVLAINAAALTIVIKLLQFIFNRFANYILMFDLLYKKTGVDNVAGGIAWLFAAVFLLGMSGWLINMMYYRSGTLLKVLISLAPLLILTLLSGVNRLSGGAFTKGIGRGFMEAMGFSGAAPNPYIASVSMLLLAVIFSGLIFLLLRKAPLRD